VVEEDRDEIWLSHLRPNENKWIVLTGECPHTLVSVADELRDAVDEAERKGYTSENTMLFRVPPFHPICVTPFPATASEGDTQPRADRAMTRNEE
jgi:hypothetical protein